MNISKINNCCEPPKKLYAQPLRKYTPAFTNLGNKLDITTKNIKTPETLGNKLNFVI